MLVLLFINLINSVVTMFTTNLNVYFTFPPIYYFPLRVEYAFLIKYAYAIVLGLLNVPAGARRLS